MIRLVGIYDYCLTTFMTEDLKKSQIEVLSRHTIEGRVGTMLQHLLPDRGDDSSPPDLSKIVSSLQTRFHVNFLFIKNLGTLASGAKILGMFNVAPLTIHVCASVPAWSPDFCRTLAHELGHLVLHRCLIGEGKYISKDKPIVDTVQQLRYRETADLSDLGWVEWQANEFSMCLLLPRRYLQSLVIFVQIEIGIKRNLGTMYLDDQWCNKQDCHRIVWRIAELSGAKPVLIWRRLRFLGILEDHQKHRERQMFGSFRSLFETDKQHEELNHSTGILE